MNSLKFNYLTKLKLILKNYFSAMVAKELADDSFALIFGINTLFALIFQTIMTVVVISESGFALDPRGQFLVYGSYFIFLSALFLVASLIKFVRKRFLN